MKNLMFIMIAIASLIYGANDNIFRGQSFSDEESAVKTKSVYKAVGLSLLLPGTGERYLGNSNTGNYLTAIDGVCIGSAVAFGTYGYWQEREYKSFAQKYGGIDVNGKEDEFFNLIAKWSSRDNYNYYMLVTTHDYSTMFAETPEWYWNWRDGDIQLKYYNIYTSSERSWRNFKTALALAGLNRVISAINVVRIYRYGDLPMDVSVAAYPDRNGNAGIQLRLFKNF